MQATLLKQKPHPALLPFVKEYWLLDLKQGSNAPLAVTPIPEQCLYFYPRSLPMPILDNQKLSNVPDNVLIGQSLNRSALIVPDNYVMFKILFQTGGLFRLFGTPMTLFAGNFFEIVSILGNPINELREKIFLAQGFQAMIEAIESYLLPKAQNCRIDFLGIDKVLNQANFYQLSLDKLASEACLSPRQFERKFLERLGISPKIYQRIVRFNQAMKLKAEFPAKKWIDITYACGYFDQMHLLRDFKQFTGEVPSNFDFENSIIY
jgi:AraC-like DNA-binding protein